MLMTCLAPLPTKDGVVTVLPHCSSLFRPASRQLCLRLSSASVIMLKATPPRVTWVCVQVTLSRSLPTLTELPLPTWSAISAQRLIPDRLVLKLLVPLTLPLATEVAVELPWGLRRTRTTLSLSSPGSSRGGQRNLPLLHRHSSWRCRGLPFRCWLRAWALQTGKHEER